MPIHKTAAEHFVRNAWEPIAIPRWALVLKYGLFMVCGIVTFIVGQPTLSFTTFSGYEPIWAGVIGIGGLIAGFGALRAQWAAIEAWGGSIILSFMTVLIIGLVSRGSYSIGILLLVTYIVPLVRTGFLITRAMYTRKAAKLI